MRRDTFISLSFLDQIMSAGFLSKISKLFGRWKSSSIRLIWHPAKVIESYKKMPLGGAKDEHFSCFHSSCHWGLRIKQKIWFSQVQVYKNRPTAYFCLHFLGIAKHKNSQNQEKSSSLAPPRGISSIFDKCPDGVITSITTKPYILQKTLFYWICSKFIKV